MPDLHSDSRPASSSSSASADPISAGLSSAGPTSAGPTSAGMRLRLRYGAALILGVPAYISFIILYLAQQITDAGLLLGIFFSYICAYIIGLVLLRHLTNILMIMERAVAPDPLERSPITFGAILAFGFPTLLDNISRLNRTWDKRLSKLQQEWSQLQKAIAYLPQPVIILDQASQIMMVNEPALSLASQKISVPDLINHDVARIIRDPKILDTIKKMIDGTQDSADQELTVTGATTQTFSLQIRRVPPPTEYAPETSKVPTILIMWQDLSLSRQIEQTRVDFVANVSHELRTPLASLSGFIETLQGPAKGDVDASERFLMIMAEQTARMTRLVSDLLSLSRIELNEATPPTEVISIYNILIKVLNVLRITADKQNVTLNLYGPATHHVTFTDRQPTALSDLLVSTDKDSAQITELSNADLSQDLFWKVLGDPDELSQVFQNLIENAIKYGQSGEQVDIFVDCVSETAFAARNDAPFLAISIRDYGEGIADHHIPRLTERFYRADPARSRALGGTGLGLAIVKHILNRHKAHLSIDSKIGDGSTFAVNLPLYQDQ